MDLLSKSTGFIPHIDLVKVAGGSADFREVNALYATREVSSSHDDPKCCQCLQRGKCDRKINVTQKWMQSCWMRRSGARLWE